MSEPAVTGGLLIDEIVYEGARRMLAAALEAVVAAYIAAHADQRDEQGAGWWCETVTRGHGRWFRVPADVLRDPWGGTPLLLHGGLFNIDLQFGELIPRLAATRQVSAADVQGHGRTNDIDRPPRSADLGADVVDLLRHLGVAQAEVFGFSARARRPRTWLSRIPSC